MRISIVTLALDSPQFIEETVSSIRPDGPFELEHILIHDGDDSFLKEFKRRHPSINMIKGGGVGATAAAARGVDAATGDFILFLHSDDRLGGEALIRLAICAAERPDVKIWTGSARIFRTLENESEQTVRSIVDRDTTRLSLENICDDIPLFSARFCHRSVYQEIGNFDPNFSECSDREFLLRAVMARIVDAPLDVLVSELRLHDRSRTIHSRQGWVPPYLVEHIKLAEEWLVRVNHDRRVQRFIRNWRAREILRLCFYQWLAGEWKAAIGSAMCAELTDPLWIFRLGTVFTSRWRRARHAGRDLMAQARSDGNQGS
jgi:glycosyltransferase involved in cell wall biosynthesis